MIALDTEERREYEKLRERYGGSEGMGDSPTIAAMARAIVARRRAATPAFAVTLKNVLGLKEQISLWLLLRWGRKNMDKIAELVKSALGTAVGNARAAWILSVVGALVVALGAACTQGQEVFSHETCAQILMVSGALNIFARFAPQSETKK